MNTPELVESIKLLLKELTAPVRDESRREEESDLTPEQNEWLTYALECGCDHAFVVTKDAPVLRSLETLGLVKCNSSGPGWCLTEKAKAEYELL